MVVEWRKMNKEYGAVSPDNECEDEDETFYKPWMSDGWGDEDDEAIEDMFESEDGNTDEEF